MVKYRHFPADIVSPMRYWAAVILLLVRIGSGDQPPEVPAGQRQAERPRLALVLSGGGARGIAHIGVLQALEEAGIVPDLIVGTSIGAVIGGLYASGYSAAELDSAGGDINWSSLFEDTPPRRNLFVSQNREHADDFLEIRWNGFRPSIPTGYTRGQKLTGILTGLLMQARYHPVRSFDDLKIPFRAVCTDLATGEKVVLDRGNLSEALRASMSVPLFFTPVDWNGRWLVDGGLVDCVPVEEARNLGADVVLAVNMAAILWPPDQVEQPLTIADQVLSIMMQIPNRIQLEKADVVVEPPVADNEPSDFTNFKKLVRIGAEAMRRELPALQKKLRPPGGAAAPRDADTAGSKGAAVTVKRVALEGVTLFPDSVVQRCFRVGGARYNADTLTADLGRLKEVYREQGFSFMSVSSHVFNPAKGILSVRVAEGRVRSIRVSGNARTAPYVILREFPLTEGAVFNVARVRKGIATIYGTELFDNVNTDIRPHGEEVDITILVTERLPVISRTGLRYDLDERAAGFAELGTENLLGTGVRANLRVLYADRRELVRLRLGTDRILKSYFSSELDLRYRYRRFTFNELTGSRRRDRLDYRSWGGHLQFGSQIRRFGHTSLGVRFQRYKRLDSRYGTQTVDDEIKGITLHAVIDTRDRYPYPVRGKEQRFVFETGQSLTSDDVIYAKAFFSVRSYYTLGALVTLEPGLLAGVGDLNVPFTERFFLGGTTAGGERVPFTGYRSSELWGRNLLMLNTNARVRLGGRLHLLLRSQLAYVNNSVDFMGRNVVFDWELFQDNFRDNLHYGTGAGLGLETPLGPMELLYGYGDDGLETDGVLYLNLGYDF